PLAVQAELPRKPVETPDRRLRSRAELDRADQRRQREPTLAEQRLGIDHEPRLTLRREDIRAVQVLMDEHLLALCRHQVVERGEGGVDELALERPARRLPRPRK